MGWALIGVGALAILGWGAYTLAQRFRGPNLPESPDSSADLVPAFLRIRDAIEPTDENQAALDTIRAAIGLVLMPGRKP